MDSLTATSEHFIINYWIEDAHAIGQILELLENNYNRITSFLQVELPEKSVLCVYPSIDKFHAAIGRAGAPDWVAGCFDEDSKIISIVSPNNPGTAHDYDSVLTIAVHELVHLAAALVNNNAPSYLAEGLATFLAGQEDNVKEHIQEGIANDNFPTIVQLKNMTDGIYQYGYAFVKYIVSEYTVDDMLKLYKTADISRTFAIDENEFHKNWKAYLIRAYSQCG